MASVADDMRHAARLRVLTLKPAARLELALRLGDDDVAAFARACGVTRPEARRLFGRARRIGRQKSPCIDGLAS